MRIAAVALAVLFAAIYFDALGHGFVKDDFRWIAEADVHSAGDLRRIFATNVGFYRPLVTLSFAIDRGICGLDPRGYAITNLLVLAADAGLLFVLARRLSLSSSASLFAVATWMFNFHGINMALLWISGRTALLLCLFSLFAVLAWVRGWRVAAALLALAAMLCKEEATVLPLLLVFGPLVTGERSTSMRNALRSSWPLWVAAAVYLIARAQSGAFGLADAPAYYRLTFDPRVLVKNAVEYLDRGATWPAVAAVLIVLLTRAGTSLNDVERRVIRFGVVWFVLMFGLTVFLPVRSSLYAVAPSIGGALAVASFASRAQRAAPYRFARVSAALIVAAAALIPVYRMRNQGLIRPADLSTQAITELQRAARLRRAVREIVLIDEPGAAVTLEDAFGALAPDAVRLFVSPEVLVSTSDSSGGVDAANAEVLVFRLREGRLVQERVRTNGSPADTSASHPG